MMHDADCPKCAGTGMMMNPVWNDYFEANKVSPIGPDKYARQLGFESSDDFGPQKIPCDVEVVLTLNEAGEKCGTCHGSGYINMQLGFTSQQTFCVCNQGQLNAKTAQAQKAIGIKDLDEDVQNDLVQFGVTLGSVYETFLYGRQRFIEKCLVAGMNQEEAEASLAKIIKFYERKSNDDRAHPTSSRST